MSVNDILPLIFAQPQYKNILLGACYMYPEGWALAMWRDPTTYFMANIFQPQKKGNQHHNHLKESPKATKPPNFFTFHYIIIEGMALLWHTDCAITVISVSVISTSEVDALDINSEFFGPALLNWRLSLLGGVSITSKSLQNRRKIINSESTLFLVM